MFNYHFTDNLSLQIKGGIPPKVRIKGVGTTYSPLRGTNITPLGDIELKRDTYITNLEQGSSALQHGRGYPQLNYIINLVKLEKIN
jgi:hypothetical protein